MAVKVNKDKPDAQGGKPDNFTFVTRGGSTIVVGRPGGVQKLRLRRILTQEQMADPEILEIGKAVLCIASFDGVQPPLMNNEHFESVLMRFGSDEDIDLFMSEWQRFANPDVFERVSSALEEGMKKGLMGEKLSEFVTSKMMALGEERLEEVKS